MRVFAGPNGSGKSSVIKSLLNTEFGSGKKLDFGIYINADDIAVSLRDRSFKFSSYEIEDYQIDFFEIVSDSGLLSDDFSQKKFQKSLILYADSIEIKKERDFQANKYLEERVAQIVADYLRKKLLLLGKKFSFETVFSHPGKVDIIKKAKENGYKVYLYFVSTEDPEINVYRVKKVRVPNNGHDVPEEKIRSRYFRSMDLVYEASQYCYQCYFFDNSKEGLGQVLFAYFKLTISGVKEWVIPDESQIPNWFKKYYSGKINNSNS